MGDQQENENEKIDNDTVISDGYRKLEECDEIRTGKVVQDADNTGFSYRGDGCFDQEPTKRGKSAGETYQTF